MHIIQSLFNLFFIFYLLFIVSCDNVRFSSKSKNFKPNKYKDSNNVEVNNNLNQKTGKIDTFSNMIKKGDSELSYTNNKLEENDSELSDTNNINNNNNKLSESNGDINSKKSCNMLFIGDYTLSTPKIFYTRWQLYVFIPSNTEIQNILHQATKYSKCSDKVGIVVSSQMKAIQASAYAVFKRWGSQYNQPEDIPNSVSKDGIVYMIKDKFGELGSADCPVYWFKAQMDDTYERVGDNIYAGCDIKYQ